MNALRYIYIMALNIQDSHHNVGYDFVTHIINVMHNKIVASQKGDMGNFKFYYYSFLVYIILYKYIGHIIPHFIEKTKENGDNLPV